MSQMDRKTLIKRAGVGAGALALPAAFGASSAFGLPPNGQRFYAAVAFSGAPASGDVANPRIALNICGNFKPDAGWINGGGSWILLDWPGGTGTATFISSGLWRPTELVSYQNFTPTVGLIQASLVGLRADFEGLANDVAMTLICNIGPAGVLTGQPEGWKATIPPYGLFAPIGVGITHTSVEGVRG
jgi:hypothetical protein